MRYIESLLDRHTMYQVIITVLGAWVVVAFGAALLGELPYSVGAIAAALAVLLGVSIAVHYVCAFITKAPANLGSTIITALILFFIFGPSLDLVELAGLTGVAAVAVVSKYVISFRHLHLLNPVAIAAVIAGVVGFSFATWWVATPVMVLFIAIGGVLIVSKIDRWGLVLSGILTAFVSFIFVAGLGGYLSTDELVRYVVSAPLLFFMFVMVTEPLTTPAGTKKQIAYGVLIGVLLNVPFSFGPLYNSPELTLVLANLAAYPFTLRSRLSLKLTGKTELAHQTVEYQFQPSYPLAFTPGQYLEWTLPHKHADRRGIRRYFTIASTPKEECVRLAVRMSEHGSTFKKALANLESGQLMYATARSGDFVLPSNYQDKKFIFVAGGIGVTPFRSHIQHAMEKGQPLDAMLFYCNKTEAEIAYRDFFTTAAEKIGLKTTYVINEPTDGWTGETGFIDLEMLKRTVPDFAERIVYISGPPGMVGAYSGLFRKNGVPRRHIRTDYFPGLA